MDAEKITVQPMDLRVLLSEDISFEKANKNIGTKAVQQVAFSSRRPSLTLTPEKTAPASAGHTATRTFFVNESARELMAEIDLDSEKQELLRKKLQYQAAINECTGDIYQERDAQTLVELIQKKSHSNKEMNFFKKCMLKMPVFQRNQTIFQSEQILKKLKQEFKLVKYNVHEVVMKIGEIGDLFYILLQGSCYVLLPAGHQTQQQKSNYQQLARNEHHFQNGKLLFNDEQFIEFINRVEPDILQEMLASQNGRNDLNHLSSKYSSLRLIKMLHAGDSFGDIALIGKGRRTATLVAKEPCIMLTLSASSYERFLGDAEREEMMKRTKFFKKFSFLSSFPYPTLLSILLDFKPSVHHNGYVLYKEGDKTDKIYFIERGECKISLLIQLPETEDVVADIKTVRSGKHKSMLNKREIIRQKKARQMRVELVTFSAGSYFGEYEISSKLKQRVTCAYCSCDETIIQFFPKDMFLERLNQNAGAMLAFQNEASTRRTWQNQHIQKVLTVHNGIGDSTLLNNLALTNQQISLNKQDQIQNHNKFNNNLSPRAYRQIAPSSTELLNSSMISRLRQQMLDRKKTAVRRDSAMAPESPLPPLIKRSSHHTSLSSSQFNSVIGSAQNCLVANTIGQQEQQDSSALKLTQSIHKRVNSVNELQSYREFWGLNAPEDFQSISTRSKRKEPTQLFAELFHKQLQGKINPALTYSTAVAQNIYNNILQKNNSVSNRLSKNSFSQEGPLALEKNTVTRLLREGVKVKKLVQEAYQKLLVQDLNTN